MKIDFPPARPRRRQDLRLRCVARALVVLATCAVGTVLYFGHEVFVPVVLALLLQRCCRARSKHCTGTEYRAASRRFCCCSRC